MRATTLWVVPMRAAIPACCLPQNQAKPIGASQFCALVYWWLALPPYNALGPTAPLVFQNAAYAACTEENKGNWMLCKSLPAEYTTFSPLAYSLDILLPLVDLGQKNIGCACLTGLKFFTAGLRVCYLWPSSRAYPAAVRRRNKYGSWSTTYRFALRRSQL